MNGNRDGGAGGKANGVNGLAGENGSGDAPPTNIWERRRRNLIQIQPPKAELVRPQVNGEPVRNGALSNGIEVKVNNLDSSEGPKAPASGNVWTARKQLKDLTLAEPKPTSNGEIPAVAAKSSAATMSSALSSPRAPCSPAKDKVVIQAISSKLVLLGDAEKDPNRLRPHRLKTEPIKRTLMPVVANHFEVTFNNLPEKVYHYDVVITPKDKDAMKDKVASEESTVPDRLLHIIWRVFEETFHKRLGARIPFDGKKNCYSAKPLQLNNNNAWNSDITMTDPDDDDKKRTYKITLKLANVISTNTMFTYLRSCKSWEHCDLPQDVIQALDVALRYCPSLHYTPCNRSFYASQNPHNLSDMLELWFGHNQSLLLGRDERATLNVDMANKAFIKKLPVERVLCMLLKIDNTSNMAKTHWRPSDFRKAEEFMKGKLVEYGTGRITNGNFEKHHRFVAVKVMEHTAGWRFTLDGVDTSIQEYFQQQKGITLKHPDWPVLHVGNKNMTNYVPIELCHIVPQAYKGKLDARDTSEMIKGAAKPPEDRFRRIQTSRVNSKFEKCPILKEFGMNVSDQMLQINSAVKLPKPAMKYRNVRGTEESVEPKGSDGKFIIGQFLNGAEVPKIGIINACGKLTEGFRDTIKKNLMKMLGDEAKQLGMKSVETAGKGRPPVDLQFKNADYQIIKAKIVNGGNQTNAPFSNQTRDALAGFKKVGCGLVIVIIGKDGNEYPTVKNEAEVQVGILTQCIKESTVNKLREPRGAKQVLVNILLKINAKLGGINFSLGHSLPARFNQEPVLILGADVTHPAPHSKSPSVAAITASYDLSGVCFQMHIQVQDPAEEVIQDFEKVVEKALKMFKIKTGKGPKRIIMFRDGVSEGQFPQIKSKEYQGIVAACHLCHPAYNPKITFVVVKKRHHTRFRPVNKTDSVPPKNNIPPGTCVDTVITHPTEMEYFLNSHVGIQGTSKPTRYHVIHDDSQFRMEDLELLTYHLCYTFVRCTQPVSYPAPTYYAHLAAFRARALLEKEGDNANFETLSKRMTINPELSAKYPMFFV